MLRSLRPPLSHALRLFVALAPATAFAQAAGVSDERVTLPDGPGSIGGVGANVSVNPAMGGMSHSVGIEVPQGWPGLTPQVALGYSSMSGSGLLGIGWSMDMPSIERATMHRLPEYKASDEFVAGGGDLLVKSGSVGTAPMYRSRIEGGFARYQWLDASDGKGGYWKEELPDGLVSYYGADQTGKAIDAARVTTPDGGVFRYMLVVTVDRYGHQLRYKYKKTAQYPLLDTIEYNDDTTGAPRFRVMFTYEARGSDIISDAHAGFELVLDKRLSGVAVLSGVQAIHSYLLEYESDAESGGFSRLRTVRQYGLNNVEHPIHWTFAYSKSLGGSCTGPAGLCGKPLLVDMGQASGAGKISTGRAIFIDLNGDALPDLLTSDDQGVHTIQLAIPSKDGKPAFAATATPSQATPLKSNFVIGTAEVQVMDANGDGFVDLVNAKKGQYLCNYGEGDWSTKTDCVTSAGSADVGDVQDTGLDATNENASGMRFFDYDGDHRSDWLRTASGGDKVLLSTGAGFAAAIAMADPIGKVFDQDDLQLADMNGDNLQDAVLTSGNLLTYKLYYGRGHWGPWKSLLVDGFGSAELAAAELMDINGDGLADVVVAQSGKLKFALNRNGAKFDAPVTISGADVAGLPVQSDTVLVTYADMNGNGSQDVVYVDKLSGHVQFLDLFPTRPNLLTKIENGIGMVQEMTYGTSVAEFARDAEQGKPWLYKLPNAMNLVTSTDNYVTLTPLVHDLVTYRYRDGYFDGKTDKGFRCFGHVEEERLSDVAKDFQEPGLKVMEYVVGVDVYHDVKQKDEWEFGAAVSKTEPLRHTNSEYSQCEVAGLTQVSADYPVTYVCKTGETTEVSEGVVANKVTLRQEWAYDGYGNVTKESNLGVLATTGDESFTETEFIVPGVATGEAWILNKAKRTVAYGSPATKATLYRETLSFYDADFGGDAGNAGKLSKGTPTKMQRRLKDGVYVDLMRAKLNADGQVVEQIDPNGSVADMTGHRAQFQFDGLDMKRQVLPLADGQGAYTLERRYSYEQAFHNVSEATDLAVYVGGALVGAETSQKYRYDEHGRLSKAIRTPDSDAFPSQVISYELGDPVSRLSIHKRSKTSGEPDMYTVKCADGKGRMYQSRVQLSPGQFQVNGFAVFNSQGKPVRQYQPYLATTDACDASEKAVPAGTLYAQYLYDAQDRVTSVTYEDGTQSRSVYEPLATREYAEDDNDAKNANHDTPLVTRIDGMGRTVAIDRYLTPTTKGTTALTYDDLGRLVTVTDDKGNKRTQEYDGMDRVTRVVDPNSGELLFTYDATGNLLTRKNAVTTQQFGYDGMNRQTTAWDAANEAATKSTMTYDRVKDCAECTTTSGRLAQLQYPLGADAIGDAVGLDQLGYDARGQLIFRSQRLEGHSFVTRLEYDDASRLVKKTLPDGSIEQTTFDAASRTSAIAGVITAVSYDGRGLDTSITHANGVVDARTYDQRMRAVTLRTTGGGKVLFGLDLQRNVDGSLLALTDKADAVAGRPTYGTQVTSDAWHRTLTTNLGTSAGTSELMSNSYDAIDDVLAITSSLDAGSKAHVGAMSYDAAHPNMLSKAGTLAYSYDAAGRMTARGDAKLTRNWFGRIGRVQRAGMADEVSIYAGQSARVMKLSEGGATYYVDPSFEVRDGISIAYTRLGGRAARRMSDALATQVLSDLAPATAAGTVLTPGGDKHITVGDAWLAQAAGAGLVTFAGGTAPSPVSRLLRASARRALLDDGEAVVHLHSDQIGSLVLATGANGATIGARSFYPTGMERESTAFVDTFGFTGQELETVSGLLHFGSRDLDPLTGRWDASDPAFAVLDDENAGALGEATTGYAYVANATLDHVDPTGLGKWQEFKAGAKSVGTKIGSGAGRLNATAYRKMSRSGLYGKASKAAQRNKDAAKKLQQALEARAALVGSVRTLEEVRADPVSSPALRGFVDAEFSSENLNFLEAVDALPPPGDPREHRAMRDIHNTFVTANSAQTLNISSKNRAFLNGLVKQNAPTFLYRAALTGEGGAKKEVETLMQRDTLSRFKMSPLNE